MRPTWEQIEVAAYHRWRRRGEEHGRHYDDWESAEKDLVFGLNYRYIARLRLDGPPVLLGQDDAFAAGRRKRCRFCEVGEPSASFSEPPARPSLPGLGALRVWDECDDCRDALDEGLAGAFEAFARPLIGPKPGLPPSEIPAVALKGLVRLALSVLPAAELQYVGDTIEWVTNPDHDRDARLLSGLGCHLYLTPAPIASPFLAVARRVDDEAPWPYLVAFLATSRVVFQTHLPLCQRDEDLDDARLRGPELSMSVGHGADHRASRCLYLPVAVTTPVRNRAGLVAAGGNGRD